MAWNIAASPRFTTGRTDRSVRPAWRNSRGSCRPAQPLAVASAKVCTMIRVVWRSGWSSMVVSWSNSSAATRPRWRQQISLVDLSGASFDWLRDSISATAAELYKQRNQHHIRRFPVSWMRRELRNRLGIDPSPFQVADQEGLVPDAATSAPRFQAAAKQVIDAFTTALLGRENAELLLGFPAAPFILPLSTDDPTQFTEYAKHQPAHAVRLRRTGPAGHTEWTVSPWADPDAYRLTFNLPERIES